MVYDEQSAKENAERTNLNTAHLGVIDYKIETIQKDVLESKGNISKIKDDLEKIRVNQERLKAVIGFGAFLISTSVAVATLISKWFKN